MSYPFQQQQQQQSPPPPVYEVVSRSSGGGSYGPVIGVIAVIAVLGVIAGIVGRLCSGRRIFGYGYDFEGWIERKCASCIDGRVELRPPPAPLAAPAAGPDANGSGCSAAPVGARPEGKQAERVARNPSPSAASAAADA